MSYYIVWQIELYGFALEEVNPQEEENGFNDCERSEIITQDKADIEIIKSQY